MTIEHLVIFVVVVLGLIAAYAYIKLLRRKSSGITGADIVKEAQDEIRKL